jgi:hypothetical protein
MNEHLSKFYIKDDGFEQFVERFNLVASDPGTRDAYENWLINIRVEAFECARIWAEGEAIGKAEGIAKGKVEGRAERDREIALAALEQSKKADFSDEIENLKELNIPEDIIESAIRQVKAKQDE